MNLESTFRLNNGVDIPLFGLGTYRLEERESALKAMNWALEAGYRLLDTASMYLNEAWVGEAVRESGIPRDQIFVTTKLWNSDHGYDQALSAFETSLRKLKLDYVDLYLIHWPVERLRKDSWRALERLLEEKSCRAIGVSNYTIHHLEDMSTYANVPPAVNQVEFSPFLYQQELLEYCNHHQILLQAYCSLTRGEKSQHPVLEGVAQGYQKTVYQILLRWTLQKNVSAIPKSSHQSRILENADIFDFSLSQKDMKKLDSLNEDYRVTWDPTHVP